MQDTNESILSLLVDTLRLSWVCYNLPEHSPKHVPAEVCSVPSRNDANNHARGRKPSFLVFRVKVAPKLLSSPLKYLDMLTVPSKSVGLLIYDRCSENLLAFK